MNCHNLHGPAATRSLHENPAGHLRLARASTPRIWSDDFSFTGLCPTPSWICWFKTKKAGRHFHGEPVSLDPAPFNHLWTPPSRPSRWFPSPSQGASPSDSDDESRPTMTRKARGYLLADQMRRCARKSWILIPAERPIERNARYCKYNYIICKGTQPNYLWVLKFRGYSPSAQGELSLQYARRVGPSEVAPRPLLADRDNLFTRRRFRSCSSRPGGKAWRGVLSSSGHSNDLSASGQ